jgi:DNA repair exonuclease SbcCD ATPase subunit
VASVDVWNIKELKMWMQMPKGCERISVELQTFISEKQDEEGNSFCRVPDHFAPKLLAIGGFSIIKDIPADFPDDLPQQDPLRDNVIATLTKSTESMKTEMKNLREDLGSALARLTALMTEKAELEKKLSEAEDKIEDLEEKLEDKPAPQVTASAKSK